jgi:hypothetical protein
MFSFLLQLGVMPRTRRTGTRHARLTVTSRARPPPSSVGRQRSGAAAVAWLWSSRGPAHHG